MGVSRNAKDLAHASFRGARMLYMIVEHFRDGDALPVYRRFRDRGQLAPDGLRYVASWVTDDFRRCFQIMECEDPQLLEQWMTKWEDLIEFEVTPVVTSAEAAEAVLVRGRARPRRRRAAPRAARGPGAPGSTRAAR